MERIKKTKDKISNYFEDIKRIDIEKILDNIKKRKELLFGLSLVLVIVGAVLIDGVITTKKELVNELKVSISKCKSNKIYGSVFVDEEKINRDDIDPLIRFYNAEEAKAEKLLSELNSNDKSGVLTIKHNKKLFSQNYYFEVDTVGVKVKSNYEDIKIIIDDKILNDGNVKIGLIPGLHKAKVQLQTVYGVVEKEVEVALMQNEEVFIKLDATNLNITSNFQDADVLINGESINKKVSDIGEIGPVPTNKELKIQLQREFPWGVIKSEEVMISDTPNLNLDINMVNEKLITEVKSNIDEFYTSIFNALNQKDKSLIVLTDEDIQNKIYNEINKKSIILKNNYEIKELETKIENSEFKYEDNKYKGKIVVKINYSVYKKLFSLFQSKEENMFLTDIELVGDEWIIRDIQKFEMQ